MKTFCFIPARGGSKGIPRKNIIDLCGKPLMAYTIEAAIESGIFNEVIVSTEDEEIANIAEKYGARVPFLRPKKLATDTSTCVEVALDLLNKLDIRYDILCMLLPTAPLRTASDIIKAFESFVNNKSAYSLVSVSEFSMPPQHAMFEKNGWIIPAFENEHLTKKTRREQFPKMYYPNGAIYIAKIEKFISRRTFFMDKTLGYFMSRERSIDVDGNFDLDIAGYLLQKKTGNGRPRN